MGHRHWPPRVFAVGGALALVIACAQTEVESFTRPEYENRTFQRILVIVPLDDPELRRDAELQFLEADAAYPDLFVPSFDILLPDRDRAEVDSILAARGIDAALVVALADSGTADTYVPARGISTCGTMRQTSSGVACVRRDSTSFAGYNEYQPWSTFSLTMVDAATTDTIWTGTASSDGSPDASFEDLLGSVVDHTVQRLEDDGVIRKPQQ